VRDEWARVWGLVPTLLQGLAVTLEVTFLGMVFAMTVGLGWAIARRSPLRWIRIPVAGFVEGVRSTPLLVQAYFIFYVLPEIGFRLSPIVAGILAIGLHYSSYISEVYRAGIEGVPREQWEAATALNLGRFHTWRFVILPQAIPPVIPALGNYLISMFKDTPILSSITVLEIMQRAKIAGDETFRYFEPFTIVGLLFLILSLGAAALIRWVERRLRVSGGYQ